MLSIHITFLNGRYNATDVLRSAGPDAVEWPPHPARLFAGLVAVLYEQLDNRPDWRAALEWLEAQTPPALAVPTAIHERPGAQVFCPSLDGIYEMSESLQRDALRKLRNLHIHPSKENWKEFEIWFANQVKKADNPKRTENLEPSKDQLEYMSKNHPPYQLRSLADRVFPSSTILNHGTEAHMEFQWACEPPAKHVEALGELCRRLPYLGRSSSPILARVQTQTETNPTLIPRKEGKYLLRVPCEGVLEQLDRTFANHLGCNRRTTTCDVQAYGPPEKPIHAPPHSHMQSMGWIIVEQTDGTPVFAEDTYPMARLLRKRILDQLGPVSPVLSGHEGPQAATKPHLAIVGLPFVGDHGTGRLMGFALILPRNATPEEMNLLQGVVTEALSTPIAGRCFQQVLQASTKTLSPARWCRPSKAWDSVTPLALDRHPGSLWNPKKPSDRRRAERVAAESITASCVHMGLPPPIEIELLRGSVLSGVTPASPRTEKMRGWNIPPSKDGRNARVITHARLLFPELVEGPILLGAGRFFGLGLFLPQ